jgi:hypothetical protein
VGPRAAMVNVEKILVITETRTQPLDRSAGSQSLYRLCYPSSNLMHVFFLTFPSSAVSY